MQQNSPQKTKISANQQIARSAGVVMVAMVFGQLVGVLAESLTARAFGTGRELEAFFAANRFSEILFSLVAGGALGSAFIPTFAGLLAKEKREDAWKLASSIANLLLVVMTALAALAGIFAPWVVHHILAPGFAAADPAKAELTIQLLRIQLPSAVIFGLSGLAMGTLNTHQSFLLPALAPCMYQLGWIIGILIFAPYIGIYGLAWGIVLGALMHLLIQLPALAKLPYKHYSFSLGLDNCYVYEVARLMGPRLLGVAVVQLNFLLNTYLASLQPSGSLNGISLAFPLMLMPEAAIAQSAAIAALPTFSAQAALGKLEEMRLSLASILRGVLLLAIPATVGLVLLRRPLVALVYQRGEFSTASTELVAWALLFYALGLVGHCMVEIIARAFYALHDTKTPVFIGIAAMTLNLLFSFLFSFLFTRWSLPPHGGLALANSAATVLEMVGLLYLMRRRMSGLHGAYIWRGVGLASLASALMGGLLWFWMATFPNQSPLVLLAGGVTMGVALYGVVMLILHVDEVHLLMRLIRRRLVKGN